MSVFVRDEAGNPLDVSRAPRRINVRISEGKLPSEKAWDDRFTDDGGNTAFPGAAQVVPNITKVGVTLHVNVVDADPRYSSASIHVEPLENGGDPLNDPTAQNVVVHLKVKDQPPTPGRFTPPFGTDEQWRRYVTIDLPRQLGYSVITLQALTAMRPYMLEAIPNAPAFWQNDVPNRTDYRPRVFLPTGNPDADRWGRGGRCYDIGNFPGDGPNIHFGDDWAKCP